MLHLFERSLLYHLLLIELLWRSSVTNPQFALELMMDLWICEIGFDDGAIAFCLNRVYDENCGAIDLNDGSDVSVILNFSFSFGVDGLEVNMREIFAFS